MDKAIHRNCACIQTSFSAYKTELTGKPSAPFERVLNSGLLTTLRSYIYFVFVHAF